MNTTNNNFIKKLESHTDNYTCISNEINLRMVAEPVADKRPSANAFALYHYLIKLPDNWSLSCDAIAKFFNWGKDKVRIVMNELISLGYLCKVRLNNEQLRGFSYKYIFFETVDCQYQFLVDLISNKDTSVSLMNADLLMDSNHKILNHTETVWYKHVYVRKPAEVQESFPYRCFPVVETPVVETRWGKARWWIFHRWKTPMYYIISIYIVIKNIISIVINALLLLTKKKIKTKIKNKKLI